jgi:hypothetical protein
MSGILRFRGYAGKCWPDVARRDGIQYGTSDDCNTRNLAQTQAYDLGFILMEVCHCAHVGLDTVQPKVPNQQPK